LPVDDDNLGLLSSRETKNGLIVSQEKIQKTIHQQLKIASAETRNTTKPDKQTLWCHTSSMPSLAQLASNAIDPNFTEYIFPVSEVEPVPGTDPLQEINLPEEPDEKIKYDGQLTPALLYQLHMEYKVCEHCEVDLCISDDIHDVVQHHADNGLDFKSMKMLSRKIL